MTKGFYFKILLRGDWSEETDGWNPVSFFSCFEILKKIRVKNEEEPVRSHSRGLSPKELDLSISLCLDNSLLNLMFLQNSFKNYFASLVEVNNCPNRKMTGFAKIMDPDISSQRQLDYLNNDEDIVFLGTNASREIQVFHSPGNLGGSVMRKFNKFVCLIGSGPNAICIEIDDANTMMSKIKVCTPTVDELECCMDSKAIEDLGDRNDTGAVTFKVTIFFIAAPWIRDLITEADTFDPFKLILMVFLAAKEFDREWFHLLKILSMQ